MNRLKCLLINPIIKPDDPPYNIPLGLICIASVIESLGHDVALFDNNAYRLKHEEIIEQIGDENWDIISIGNLVTTYTWQKRMFQLLREKFPSAVLIAGGGLATSLQQNLMEWVPEIDILCVGEGERTVKQIIENFEGHSWNNVRGILYRKDGKIIKTVPQQLLSENELSELPFPKYDLLPLDIYFKHSAIPLSPEAMVCERRLSIETSRGCPFTCSFCIDLPTGTPRTPLDLEDDIMYLETPLISKKIRYYSPKHVVDLIKHLRLKYAVDFLTLTDENLTVNKKYVMELCDLLEQEGLTDLDPPLYFGGTAHVNTLDLEMLKRLNEVGCSYLDIGAESMGKDILAVDITKGSTPEKNKWAFDECIKTGVYPITNFMIGLPHENLQSIYDTTKFFVDNDIDCGPFFVTPYPRTGLFEKHKELILKQFGNLENFITKCGDDVSLDFIVNLTNYNDAELLGIRQMMINHDIDQIIRFANEKGETIIT